MIKIGDKAERRMQITAKIVEQFAEISGDSNPIHLDEQYAATTQFGRRIAHGILVSGIISSILGNDLPGPGTIYLSQELKFKAPVFIGDEIFAVVTCSKYIPEKSLAYFTTKVYRNNDQLVIDGEAVVKCP